MATSFPGSSLFLLGTRVASWYPLKKIDLVKDIFPIYGKVYCLVTISSATLMRKPRHFSILYSFHGERNAALSRERNLTRQLQSCGRDRGWLDVTATPDTSCGWHGCKANRVDVIFSDVYCWLRLTRQKAQVILLRSFCFLFRSACYTGKIWIDNTTQTRVDHVLFSGSLKGLGHDILGNLV